MVYVFWGFVCYGVWARLMFSLLWPLQQIAFCLSGLLITPKHGPYEQTTRKSNGGKAPRKQLATKVMLFIYFFLSLLVRLGGFQCTVF